MRLPNRRGFRRLLVIGLVLGVVTVLSSVTTAGPRASGAVATSESGNRAALSTRDVVNDAPVPDFLTGCGTVSVALPCLGEVLQAINNARADEGVEPMALVLRRFVRLTPDEQVLAVTDLERTDRRLAPVEALTTELDALAEEGAATGGDASLPSFVIAGGQRVATWSSNWSSGTEVLAADYFWMYADATGVNQLCPVAGAAGCFSHRDNILSTAPRGSCANGARPHEVMGVGVARAVAGGGAAPSITELFVDACGPLPPDIVVTWGAVRRALGIR